MTTVSWLWIALSIVGATVLAALVWLAGPLVSIGDVQPVEGVASRLVIIAIILLIVAVSIALRVLAWRRAAAIAEATTKPAEEESDPTAKRRAKLSAGTRDVLPRYLVIGPPGAGKTSTLFNSGLDFIIANDVADRTKLGIVQTDDCKWLRTEKAIFIDCAGDFLAQETVSDAKSNSWHSFLASLSIDRPRQPINGIIIVLSIEGFYKTPIYELNTQADIIRKQLTRIYDIVKTHFPVYVVFTKMDLIAGFTEYFGDLNEASLKAVWGATFQSRQLKANEVDTVLAQLDLLGERLSERLPRRLIEESDLCRRAILFGFPTRFNLSKRQAADFLERIFGHRKTPVGAILRGFYFTSGKQEGTPFDAVLGVPQERGMKSFAAGQFSGASKHYFLHDLMAKVILGETGWVSTNLAASRSSFLLRVAAFSLILLATLGALALWWVSYQSNEALIVATERGVAEYSGAAGPLIKQNSVTDPSLLPIYELIGSLPNLPAGYAKRNDPVPIDQTFGLSQRSRLQEASDRMYQQALERLMRPRLILSLEQQIQRNIGNPTFVYEALKVYLMLGGKAPQVDKDLILSWFKRDWEERAFPGASYTEGRALLRAHLEAMLDMDTGNASEVSLNGPLVEQAQTTLAHIPVAERAYTLLKSNSHKETIEDWLASQHGGPDMALVFEAANGASLDTVRVPGFFTYDGFSTALLGMEAIADMLQKDNWVLGASDEQSAVKQQYVSLFPSILDLYGKDFVAAWTAVINNLQLKPLLNDKPKYLILSAASAPTSPIRLIFESIRDETALTREHPKPSAQRTGSADQAEIGVTRLGAGGREAIDKAMKSQRKAGDPPPELPGASIESYFKPFQIMVDGKPGARPIDALVENLRELYGQLVLAEENPAQAKQALNQVEVQVASLRANVTRLPQPIAGWIDKVARDAAGDTNASSLDRIANDMAREVTGLCEQIANRYPFVRSDRDVPLADFAKLFAPNGVIDKFFSANLDSLVNRTGKTWVWKPNPNLARKLSETTLRQFHQAADIRDAFFPTGDSTPNLTVEVKPLTLSSDAQTATLLINGATVLAQQGTPSVAANVAWPGAGAGEASILMAPDMPDRQSKLERTGAWALFRLVDVGSAIQSGNALKVSFVVFGREVSYQFTSSSLINPLSMPSLRQFRCPNEL